MIALRELLRVCRRSLRERISLPEAIRREAAETAAAIEHLSTRRSHVPALILAARRGRFVHFIPLYPSEVADQAAQTRKLAVYTAFFDAIEEAMSR